MPAQYNTEELIKNIKRRCAVPTSQLTFEDEDFCALATDEIFDTVLPDILGVKSEYFLAYEDFFTDNSGIITIPSKAIIEKLRSVVYVQNENPLNLVNLPRLDLDVIAGANPINFSYFAGFYLQDDKIMLYPNTAVPTGTKIRLYYFNRPLVLASPNQYAVISSINTMANSIVVSGLPADWQIGDVLNAVSSESSFGVVNEAMEITNISSPTLVLDNVNGLSVGDYVSLQGYSAIPQIPIEAHAYLAQLTAVKCLEGIGDEPGMTRAQAKANQMKENLIKMMTQRVDGSLKKVVNPNGGLRRASGLGLGRGLGSGRGWW